MTPAQYDALRSPAGALLVGNTDEVIEKMLREYEYFKYDRFVVQFSAGTMPHDKVMRAIELLGTEVAPAVRKATSRVTAAVGG